MKLLRDTINFGVSYIDFYIFLTKKYDDFKYFLTIFDHFLRMKISTQRLMKNKI